MTGPQAVAILNRAIANRVLHPHRGWNLSVGVRAPGDQPARLTYTVSVSPYARRADGSIGRRLAVPTFGRSTESPDVALVDAARWVIANYPEATA